MLSVHIPHSRPRFGPEFSRAAARVLKSGQLASGPECEALEREVAGMVGIENAAAVDSGTSALMLALYALKAEREVKRVGIPAYACRAVLHAVRTAGAEPVCMDCNEHLRLDAAMAEKIVPGLDAVILVHPFGMIEPMIGKSWPCPLIEDIAQAAGGALDGRMLGGFGDIAITSFYATKPWGGACGGMVLSRKPQICRLVRRMRDVDKADISLSYAGNHRLSDVHAALARTRLSLAAEERGRRRHLAQRYDEWFAALAWAPVAREQSCNHYRYIVRVQNAASAIKMLRARGIDAARPVEQPLSAMLGQHCPGAEAAWRACVSLPLIADMDEEEINCMREAVASV